MTNIYLNTTDSSETFTDSQVLEMNEDETKITGTVTNGSVFVDGLGVGDVGNIVLRDRQQLSEEGMMTVVLALDQATGELMAGPDIVSRGFVYVRESEELITEATELMHEVVEDLLSRGITDWGKIKQALRENLSSYIWQRTKRRPMILPVIMEV